MKLRSRVAALRAVGCNEAALLALRAAGRFLRERGDCFPPDGLWRAAGPCEVGTPEQLARATASKSYF